MIRINHKLKQPLDAIFCFILIIVFSASGFSQGIRKNFTELTASEQTALVNAYFALGGTDGDGNLAISTTYVDLYTLHGTDFNPIHFEPVATDIFLPWHRYAAYELESTMQLIDDWLTIPYWDWTVNTSSTGPLWNGFLDQFNTPWNLSRTKTGSLPTTGDVNSDLSNTTFDDFTDDLEGVVHGTPHGWVGGVMNSAISPKDPVFFFHHNMIDKIWQQWEDANPGTSSFVLTAMPRYPSVNPNTITDTRDLGVFYAENELVVLDQYAVQNNNPYKPSGATENFVYKFTIQAENNFTVPNGKSALFRSCTEIAMLPGFGAEEGSEFGATIDIDCDFSTAQKIGSTTNNIQDQSPDASNIQPNQNPGIVDNKLIVYPNPFTTLAIIEYTIINENTLVHLEVFNMMGQQVVLLIDNDNRHPGVYKVMFNGSNLPEAIYYYAFRAGNFVKTGKLILAK